MTWRTLFVRQILLLSFAAAAAFGQNTLASVGGFEGTLPSYWTMGSQPTGATLSWATDQFHSLGHSLKIVKPGATTDSAAWISENMVDMWSIPLGKNVDDFIGAYVMTQGVNTNPASNDQRWWISYSFYDSLGAFLTETKLPIDQSKASSTGWVADTNQPGETIFLKNAWKMIVKFVAGKNATGTVWAGDFVFYGRGTWGGQDWNTSVGMPTGWIYWLPPNGGNDALLANGFENTVVTTDAAHSGTHSLKFVLPADRKTHDAWVAVHRMPFASFAPNIGPGDSILIKVWIKASGLFPDSAAKYPGTWSVGITPVYYPGVTNTSNYQELGAHDYVFAFPAGQTSFDWTQFTLGTRITKDTTGGKPLPVGMDLRLHVYSQMVGTVYFDDVTVEKASVQSMTDLLGFEGTLPSYWTMGSQPTGATLSWATDQFHSLGHSLKIVKPGATTDSAAWISENMVDMWSIPLGKNVDDFIGAYVMTQGVNTNPASNDQRWWISYSFYDSLGAFLTETKLPIDQSKASSTGWVADTNQPGETIFLKNAWKMIVKFVAGKNATGTVWAGDFVFYGRGTWGGQDWNTSVGMPTGWIYWLPPNGGNDALLANGFENTVVTTDAAHSGTHSLKFVLPADRKTHDAWVAVHRMPFASFAPNIGPGDSILIKVWIKASGLFPDSAAKYPGTWSVGITPVYYPGVTNTSNYQELGAHDYVFAFPAGQTSFDWTQFTLGTRITKDTTGGKPLPVGMDLRLHVYSQMVGTVYFDDVSVLKAGVTGIAGTPGELPKEFALMQNYPNPFNPTTTIRYTLPREANIRLLVYNMLGQQVRTLVTEHQAAGSFSVVWDGRDDHGLNVGTGVYIYRMTGGTAPLVQKMLLLK